MWLTNSSIGRKVIMSVTGMALILFLTFHGCMNVVALFSKEAYNTICELLGANWYAIVATMGLAALALLHIVYAFVLTWQNRKARGSNRYEVTDKPEKVEWASQNMLVLGIIVLLGLLLHLYNFWYNMMFAELFPSLVSPLTDAAGNAIKPSDGYEFIRLTFSNPVFVVLYLVWFVAIWFHLTHGFWSAIQTLGWSGHIWFHRWRIIGIVYVTAIMLMFAAVPVMFFTKTAPSRCCAEQTEQCCGQKGDCEKACEQACEDATCACDPCACDPCDGQCKLEGQCECGGGCPCEGPCTCQDEKDCTCEPCECAPCECGTEHVCRCGQCKCDDCQCDGNVFCDCKGCEG